MNTKSEPVLIAMSILAGLTLLFGGMGLSGLGADNETVALVGAWGTLATAAAQSGIQFWVRGQVTPTADVPKIVEAAILDDHRATGAHEIAVANAQATTPNRIE